MRAVLHIGYEKTGSTALQGTLRRNRATLAARGVLFSRAAGEENHVALAAHAQADATRDALRAWMGVRSAEDLRRFRDDLRARLSDEARASDCPVIVYSSETCASRLDRPAEVERLADLLRGIHAEVEVVIYLRRQDELFRSSYAQAVRSGSTRPASDYRAWWVARRTNWDKMLAMWARAFDRVTPRLHGGDVVADFLGLLGLDARGLDFHEPTPNRSLDAARIEFLRHLNAILPRVLPDGPNPDRADLAAAMEEASTGPLPDLPAELLARIMRHAGPRNARVADRWFGGARAPSGDPLFGEPRDARARAPLGTVTVDDAAETAARLWTHCQRRIRALAAENDRLRRAADPGADLGA